MITFILGVLTGLFIAVFALVVFLTFIFGWGQETLGTFVDRWHSER